MIKTDPERLVDRINGLSNEAFVDRFVPSSYAHSSIRSTGMLEVRLELRRTRQLSESDFERCFALIEETSAAAYKNSSRGWRPKDKREEMRDENMWYWIVRQEDGPPFAGFASFMITVEDGAPVVYLYEIHLSASLRGAGIGDQLMEAVEALGRNAGMAKSMLTVFTSNEGAERFYRRRGYETDEFSPQSRTLRGGKVKRPDYVILSKALR